MSVQKAFKKLGKLLHLYSTYAKYRWLHICIQITMQLHDLEKISEQCWAFLRMNKFLFAEVKGSIYLTSSSPLYLRHILSMILRKKWPIVSKNYTSYNTYTSTMSHYCYCLLMIQSQNTSHTSQQEQPLTFNSHSEYIKKSSKSNLRLQCTVFDSYLKALAVAFLGPFPW